jgi:hypothetical protein
MEGFGEPTWDDFFKSMFRRQERRVSLIDGDCGWLMNAPHQDAIDRAAESAKNDPWEVKRC